MTGKLYIHVHKYINSSDGARLGLWLYNFVRPTKAVNLFPNTIPPSAVFAGRTLNLTINVYFMSSDIVNKQEKCRPVLIPVVFFVTTYCSILLTFCFNIVPRSVVHRLSSIVQLYVMEGIGRIQRSNEKP